MSSALNSKVDKVDGKGLSTNDYDNTEKGKVADNTTARHTHSNKSVLDSTTASYTTEEKTKLSGIESGAEANIIESVKVNGTALTPSSKAVDVTVPTKVSDLTNDSGYTTNIGTITEITMNSESKGTSGAVDLGTVITAHQDITGKEDKSNKVTSMTSSSTDTQYPSAKAVYDELEDLKEENSELKQRIEDEENNQLTNTASETNLNLNDTASYPIREIQVKGNSVQDGTPTPSVPVQIKSAGGQVNYFDKNTILEQHLIDSSGNITVDSNNFVGDYISISNSSKYTISAITNKAKRIGYYNSSKTFISREVISAYNGSLTIPSNAVYCRLSCHNDDLNSLQLEKGQFVSPYIPYYNGFGKITEIICNKNLSDGELELGNYSDSGEKIEKNDIYRNANFVKVKPQTTYTISKNGVTQKYCLYFYNKNKEFISKNTSLTSGTFTTPENTEYINFRCFAADFNSNFTTYKIQIEVGSSVTSYIQQQTQTITIPTQQPMRSIGNVRDGFIKQDGVWYEKHNIGAIESYNGETITTDYMSTTGELSTGAFVQYVLGTPNYIECTQEQVTALEAIEKARTYKKTTNVFSEDITPAYITITYVRDLESAILSYIDASVNQAIGGDY